MAVSKSSLSAGEIIRAILIEDSEVMARAKKVFPVVEDSAELPYIVYRRTQLVQTPVKGQRGADTVGIEILCYTAGYTEGVELAEAVRDALDGAHVRIHIPAGRFFRCGRLSYAQLLFGR